MVDSDFVKAMKLIIESAWEMLTKVKYPGTDMPIIMILTGAFVVYFGIRLFAWVMRMNINTGSLIQAKENLSKHDSEGW